MFALFNQVRTTLTELKLSTICPLICKDSHRASETFWVHWMDCGETGGHACCQIQEANTSLWGEWFTKGSDEKCHFFLNIYLDKKRSTSSDVGNKVQRMARSRRAMNFAQWSFSGGRKEEVLTEDLSAELSIRKSGKGVFFFSSYKWHHIHLVRQALGRRKKENIQEAILATPVTAVFLRAALKGLRLHWMMEHLVSQSVLGSVLRGTFLRTQVMAPT